MYALLAVVFFLVSHSQVKILDHFPVHQVVFIRAVGILFFSLPLMRYLKVPALGVDKKNLVLRGVFGSAALFCYFFTLQNLPLSTAIVIQQFTPFFAALISGVFLKELVPLRIYIVFSFAFLGVYLIKEPEAAWSIYYLLGFVASFLAALAYNYVRKLRLTDHSLVILTYFQFILLPVSTLLLAFKGFVVPSASDLPAILLLAVFSFVAQICLTLAYKQSEVSKAVSFGFLSVPLSAAVGYIFFNENLSLSQILGLSLVFTVVLIHVFYDRLKAQCLYLQKKHKTKR